MHLRVGIINILKLDVKPAIEGVRLLTGQMKKVQSLWPGGKPEVNDDQRFTVFMHGSWVPGSPMQKLHQRDDVFQHAFIDRMATRIAEGCGSDEIEEMALRAVNCPVTFVHFPSSVKASDILRVQLDQKAVSLQNAEFVADTISQQIYSVVSSRRILEHEGVLEDDGLVTFLSKVKNKEENVVNGCKLKEFLRCHREVLQHPILGPLFFKLEGDFVGQEHPLDGWTKVAVFLRQRLDQDTRQFVLDTFWYKMRFGLDGPSFSKRDMEGDRQRKKKSSLDILLKRKQWIEHLLCICLSGKNIVRTFRCLLMARRSFGRDFEHILFKGI
jgi:hypothetical protein